MVLKKNVAETKLRRINEDQLFSNIPNFNEYINCSQYVNICSGNISYFF